jgi:hypothetical protein
MYIEKAPLSSMLRGFLWGFFCVLLAMAVFSYFSIFGFGAEHNEFYILVFVLVIYVIAMQGILKLEYMVSPEGVLVSYSPLKYRIPFSEIESVELESGLAFYMGWGLRMHGRTLIFASSHGSGVRIRKSRGYFRTVILVSSNPEQLKSRIEAMMGSMVNFKE